MHMLTGRTALITGSTSGIGFAIAQALAKEGANILLNGLGDRQEIERKRLELTQIGTGTITFLEADLTKPTQIKTLLKKAQALHGSVDILINNAGMQHVAPLEEFPTEKWEQIINLNLSASFYTTHYAFETMKNNKWGRIINMASAHGLVASPFKSAYVAAKHGLIGLTKVIALEGAEFGITCNAVCPGYTWTPLVENQIQDTAKARGITKEEVIDQVFMAAHPTKQFTTLEQLGNLAVFLCSEGAANITGIALPIDGGWVAR